MIKFTPTPLFNSFQTLLNSSHLHVPCPLSLFKPQQSPICAARILMSVEPFLKAMTTSQGAISLKKISSCRSHKWSISPQPRVEACEPRPHCVLNVAWFDPVLATGAAVGKGSHNQQPEDTASLLQLSLTLALTNIKTPLLKWSLSLGVRGCDGHGPFHV